jgi:hypothetical protein
MRVDVIAGRSRWLAMTGALVVFSSLGLYGMLQSPGQEPLPPVPGRGWVVLNGVPGRFNEPSIAINPRNPDEIVAAFQANASVAYSRDGGRSFTIAAGTAPGNYRVSGDVSITYDDHGHAILCYIAFDRLGTPIYWAHGATRNGIFVRRSLDGGKEWEREAVPVLAHPTKPGIPFEDKPYIVADTTHSRYAGNLYVGWTEDRLTDAGILFSRSTDDGLSWSKPVQISHERALPRDENGIVEGFDGVVTPDGNLHVVWSGANDDLRYAVSRDGGRTFTRTRVIARTAPAHFRIFGLPHGNGYPQIAMIPGKSGGRAHLYVTWSDYRNGEIDVFCITSRNEGKTWSSPVRVETDPAHDGADHFLPWLATDPATRTIDVMFYDRREDPTGRTAQVVLARSTDDGRSFRNYVWTEKPFDSFNVVLGDYTGLAALDGRVYGAWTETRPIAGKRPVPTVVVVGRANFGLEHSKP